MKRVHHASHVCWDILKLSVETCMLMITLLFLFFYERGSCVCLNLTGFWMCFKHRFCSDERKKKV